MDRMELAARIKAAREKAGLTQTEAAKRLGIQQPLIAAYETGARSPLTTTVIQMIEGLGLDPQIIFPELYPRKKPRPKK